MPVIQAGMGVQVAKSALAAAVARAGGIGCISSVGLGTIEGNLNDYLKESRDRLIEEIRRARALAPSGILAVNAMVALSNYDDVVATCVAEKVDIIISGAGLPISLPGLTAGSSVCLVPVVSSGRAMNVILKAWHRRYQRLPDAVIVEGPLCGGHLGFSEAQVARPETVPIQQLGIEVRAALAPFEAEYGQRVPMLGAEKVHDAAGVRAMMALGFDGVQVGTRFICTEESGIHPKCKEIYVKAKDEDVVVIHSPLNLPVRVLRTPLVERVMRGEKIPFRCPFLCLRACDASRAHFCIANALVNTVFGSIDEALFMTGCGIGDVNDIIPAAKFFKDLD